VLRFTCRITAPCHLPDSANDLPVAIREHMADFPLTLSGETLTTLQPAQCGAPGARPHDPCRALVSQLSGLIMTVIMRSFGTPRRFAVKLDGGDR
jgi:hypothetical protein